MKNSIFLAATILIAGLSAQAQDNKKFAYYINSGYSIPSMPEKFSDYWKLGSNFGGGISYPITEVQWIRGYIAFNNFEFDEDSFLKDSELSDLGIKVDGAATTVWQGNYGTKIIFVNSQGSKAKPYLTGGFGFIWLSRSDVKVSGAGGSITIEDNSETTYSLEFGAGLDVTLSEKIALFIEGVITVANTEDEATQYLPIRIGLIYH